MFKKLICWLWGHSVVKKVYNGKQFDTQDGFGNPIKGDYYYWKQMSFCIRCGKPNKYKENVKEVGN